MKTLMLAGLAALVGTADARLLGGDSASKGPGYLVLPTSSIKIPLVKPPQALLGAGKGMMTPLWLDDMQTDVDPKKCKEAFKKLAEGCHHLAEEIIGAVKAGKITREEAKEKMEKLHKGCKAKAEALAKKCKRGDNDLSFMDDLALPDAEPTQALLGAGMFTPLWLDDSQTDVDASRCKEAFKKLAEGCHHLAKEVIEAVKAGKITREEAKEKMEAIHKGCKAKAEALAKKCKRGDNDLGWMADLTLPAAEPAVLLGAGMFTPLWLDDRVTAASDDDCKAAAAKLAEGCKSMAEAVAEDLKAGKITKIEAAKKLAEVGVDCANKAAALAKKCAPHDATISHVVGGIENMPLTDNTVPIPEN